MSQSAEKTHMNLAEYKLKFLHSYFFVLVISYLLGIFLVYPKYGLLSIALQLAALNFYVYGIHRLTHNMPSMLLNYHMYSHHNKSLGIPRPLELFCEFFCDLSWFALLALTQYLLKLDILSNVISTISYQNKYHQYLYYFSFQLNIIIILLSYFLY